MVGMQKWTVPESSYYTYVDFKLLFFNHYKYGNWQIYLGNVLWTGKKK